MRSYELVFITQPDLDDDALSALAERLRGVISSNGGQVAKIESMGRRKLAYPIQRRQMGHYMLMHAQLERPAILETERLLKLSEDVMRYLLVRLDEDISFDEEVAETPAEMSAETVDAEAAEAQDTEAVEAEVEETPELDEETE